MRRRILFAFVGGRGHLDPLVPIARAAIDAGHEVAVASGRWMADAVHAAGLPLEPFDDEADDASGAAGDAAPDDVPPGDAGPARGIQPLLAVDRVREESDLREKFVREAAPSRAARMLALAQRWRPAAIVVDEVDLGSVVAAELLGIPCASVIVLAAGGFLRPDVVAQALDEVRAAHGLAPDPDLARARGRLVIDPSPPGYRDPADPLPADRTVPVRLMARPAAPSGPPPWTVTRPGRPAVYVTLGTIFNAESGDLFERVLGGVAGHDGDVLVTVGHDLDPGDFGGLPAHVRVERFVPQAAVLPHVAAVVSHAGSGSVLGALAHARPMVLLPMGADQPWNGDRCAALGVARVLDPVAATPDDVASALSEVLTEPSFAARAATVAETWAGVPGPEAAVAAIERLVAQPV